MDIRHILHPQLKEFEQNEKLQKASWRARVNGGSLGEEPEPEQTHEIGFLSNRYIKRVTQPVTNECPELTTNRRWGTAARVSLILGVIGTASGIYYGDITKVALAASVTTIEGLTISLYNRERKEIKARIDREAADASEIFAPKSTF